MEKCSLTLVSFVTICVYTPWRALIATDIPASGKCVVGHQLLAPWGEVLLAGTWHYNCALAAGIDSLGQGVMLGCT